MNFKKIKRLGNIDHFVVNKFGMFCLTNFQEIPQAADIDLVRAGFDKYSVINLVGDFLTVQDKFGRAILYDLTKKKIVYQHLNIEEKGHGFSSGNVPGDRNLLCTATKDGCNKKYILDVDSRATTVVNNQFNRELNNGEILLDYQLKLPAISRVTLDGDVLWKYKIEGAYRHAVSGEMKPNKLYRILGEHNNLLWFSDSINGLYALDVETGNRVFSTFDAGPAHSYSIDKENNLLLSVDASYLRKIDLSKQNFNLSKIDIAEQFDKLDCNPDYGGKQLPVVNGHLIFCDKFKSVIGTIDINDGQVKWVHDIFDTRDYAMIYDLKYFDGTLYALDNVHSGANLHIFEQLH